MASSSHQPSPLEILRTDINHTLESGHNREERCRNFLRVLQFGQVSVSDWENSIVRLPSGSAYKGGDFLPGTKELLATLSELEKTQLREHYFSKLKDVEENFPHLKIEFPEQFK
jgi:hypothetical protein